MHDKTFHGGQAAQDAKHSTTTQTCEHTESHLNSAGNLQGSWEEIPIPEGLRIQCRCCGKIFGTIRDTSPEDAMRAYMEQQARRACPGCGESPFLG